MAFTSARTAIFSISRSKRMATGTFTNGATDVGGTIATGLRFVDTFLWSCSSHIGTESLMVTKNASGTGGNVAIVTDEGADGDWIAVGL